METNFDFMNRNRRKNYISYTGVVIEIQPMRMGNRRANGCTQMVGVQDEEGNFVNFVVSPNTYVVDCATIREGMRATFFYDGDAAVPLIYPPQYQSLVVVPVVRGQNATVGYFTQSLLSADRSLQLNISSDTQVLTMNHQTYIGNPGNHYLIVVYGATTRSIPPQTTPDKVIVMCGM